ncbi:unnamed protein product, partial [Protopolystoma xenopodis]
MYAVYSLISIQSIGEASCPLHLSHCSLSVGQADQCGCQSQADDADLFAISRLISPRASPPTATTERRLSGLDLFSSPDPPLPLLVSTSPTGV